MHAYIQANQSLFCLGYLPKMSNIHLKGEKKKK